MMQQQQERKGRAPHTPTTPLPLPLAISHAAVVRSACMLRLVACAARARGGQRASLSSSASPVPLPVAAFCVWGSNTGVGKTLISAGLAAQEAARGGALLYVKPLQTGFPADSDGAFVARAAQRAAPASAVVHTLGAHAAAAAPSQQPPAAQQAALPCVTARTLFAWHHAVGPHLAAARDGRSVADGDVAVAVAEELRSFARATAARSPATSHAVAPLVLVETAGGVSSPGPGGTLQCDLLRALRLPAVLVGDGQLGCAPSPEAWLACAAWARHTSGMLT